MARAILAFLLVVPAFSTLSGMIRSQNARMAQYMEVTQ